MDKRTKIIKGKVQPGKIIKRIFPTLKKAHPETQKSNEEYTDIEMLDEALVDLQEEQDPTLEQQSIQDFDESLLFDSSSYTRYDITYLDDEATPSTASESVIVPNHSLMNILEPEIKIKTEQTAVKAKYDWNRYKNPSQWKALKEAEINRVRQEIMDNMSNSSELLKLKAPEEEIIYYEPAESEDLIPSNLRVKLENQGKVHFQENPKSDWRARKEAEVNRVKKEIIEKFSNSSIELLKLKEIEKKPKKITHPKITLVHQFTKRNEKGMFQCDVCGKEFSYRKNFKQHRMGHKKQLNTKELADNTIDCLICGKTLKPSAFDYHMKYKHSEERKFVCLICGRGFKSPGAMRHHVNSQHKEEEEKYQFECRICGKRFDQAQQLAKHSKNDHEFIEEKDVRCKYCNEKFPNKQKLTLHIGILGKLKKCRNTVNGMSSGVGESSEKR